MDAQRPLDHQVFADVPVQAFRQPLLDFCGGPVLRDPAMVHFRHKKHDRVCDSFEADASFDDYLDGEWVYVGPKYHHFGHIMAEFVHRIIPSKILFPKRDRYMLVTTFDDSSPSGFEGLDLSYRQILEFAEVDPSRVRTVNRNSLVESLSICEQGSNFGGRPNSWYLDVLRDFSSRRLDGLYGSRTPHAKVYVSKSRIAHGGRILGESYLEELLSHEGYFIFHPQEVPLSLQMDVYRKAKKLIFSEGSACHGTELLGRRMLESTYVLIRRKEVCEDLVRILGSRSQQFDMFVDTFLLGTVVVHAETRRPHTEFGVSLLDLDRLVAFFRDRQLARLDDVDVRQYFDAAELDLKAYFSYHTQSDVGDLDTWRVGEVRMEFEKVRQRFLGGHVSVPLDLATAAASEDADSIAKKTWAAHQSKRWLEAAQWWEIYRERFPNAQEGFTLGAVALIELGRFYEADALLRPAMEKFPDSSEVHGDYALVAQHRRDWGEAISRWEAFRARFPQDKAGYSLAAIALCELGRYSEAATLAQLGLDFIPDDEELLEKHAWIAQLSGNMPEARRRWKKLRTKFPENLVAQRHLKNASL